METFIPLTLVKQGVMKKISKLADINGVEVACDLVLMPEWKTRLPEFFTGALTE